MIARPAPSMPLHFNSRPLNKTSGCSSHSSNNGDNNSSKCPLGSHGNHSSNGASRNNHRRWINHHWHCQIGQGCSHLHNSRGNPREEIIIVNRPPARSRRLAPRSRGVSRIDQIWPLRAQGRDSERHCARGRGSDRTECLRSDPGMLPQCQALQLLC